VAVTDTSFQVPTMQSLHGAFTGEQKPTVSNETRKTIPILMPPSSKREESKISQPRANLVWQMYGTLLPLLFQEVNVDNGPANHLARVDSQEK